MKLKFQDEHIQLTGFFGSESLVYKWTPFRVMNAQQVDDFNGLHDMLVLVLSNGIKIPFSK